MTSAAPCIASCPQHGELHEPAGADGLSSEFAEEVGRDGNHGHRGPWAGRDESRAFLDPRIARTAGILLDSLVGLPCKLLPLLGEVAQLLARIRRDLFGFFPCLGHTRLPCLRSRHSWEWQAACQGLLVDGDSTFEHVMN